MREEEISILHISIFSMSVSMASWISNMGGGRGGALRKTKRKTQLFTSLKVLVAFVSTKVCFKQKKQNKQTLNFVLHPKTSKSI